MGAVNTLEPVASAVTFTVLGDVAAEHAGRTLDLGGPRQRALLALLLVKLGQTAGADELADELWAGEPPEGAQVTLRSYISRLRAALGSAAAIVHAPAGYRIDVRREQVDATQFADLVREAGDAIRQNQYAEARRKLAAALNLWQGRPFGELAQDGLLRLEADRLSELRLHALELRIEADIELGRGAQVVDELEMLVRQEPFREQIWRLLMLALYHSGRQAEALAVYQRARTMLDEQLGLDPSSQLQELEGQILRQEVALPRGRRRASQLPVDLTTFVGRDPELTQIAGMLTASRLVTLTGVGGVGKTRLAIEAARRASRDTSEGAVFVDLAPVTERSAVPRTLSRALGLREQSSRSVKEAIAAELANSTLLIVLDNCEHIAATAAELAELVLVSAAGVRVLATSRVPLGSPGEAEFTVAPLPTAAVSASPDEMRSSDAVRLLLERASTGRVSLNDEESLRQAARICRDLDGIPLAIELAAARSNSLTLNEIAERLDDRFRFLVSWRRVSAARHQTLAQTMDWSYDLLSPEERRLFADLSVFAGGFGVEAAARVSLGGDEGTAVDLVGRLVEASLLVADTQRQRARYTMLETVRQYAATRLEQEGRTDAMRASHAVYFATLAQTAEPELTGAKQLEWFGRLDEELDNIRAAMAWLAERGASEATRLLEFTVSLTRFLYVRGYLAEAREQLERSLRGATDVAAPLQRRALTAAASVALLQGDYPIATDFAERSLAVARATGEQRLVANGLSNLGAILLAGGENERSGAVLGQAVDLARTVDDNRILALALNNLGDHALTVGHYTRAEPLLEESLALLRERGDTANVARSLFNLGAVALELGRDADAELRLRESLVASRQAGDKEDMCWCLLGLAGLSAERGDGERAATLLGAADALLSAMGAAFKPFERSLHERTARRAQEALGDALYSAAREHGATMLLEAALEYASAA